MGYYYSKISEFEIDPVLKRGTISGEYCEALYSTSLSAARGMLLMF